MLPWVDSKQLVSWSWLQPCWPRHSLGNLSYTFKSKKLCSLLLRNYGTGCFAREAKLKTIPHIPAQRRPARWSAARALSLPGQAHARLQSSRCSRPGTAQRPQSRSSGVGAPQTGAEEDSVRSGTCAHARALPGEGRACSGAREARRADRESPEGSGAAGRASCRTDVRRSSTRCLHGLTLSAGGEASSG